MKWWKVVRIMIDEEVELSTIKAKAWEKLIKDVPWDLFDQFIYALLTWILWLVREGGNNGK